jgi:hypothetical protein
MGMILLGAVSRATGHKNKKIMQTAQVTDKVDASCQAFRRIDAPVHAGKNICNFLSQGPFILKSLASQALLRPFHSSTPFL